jgi:hypothetical protein
VTKGIKLKILLYLLNITLGLLILVWPLGLFASMFMFDAPGSESNFLTVALAMSILLYPLTIFYGSSKFFKERNLKSNTILFKYTLLSFAGPSLVIILSILLGIFCNGKFNCP